MWSAIYWQLSLLSHTSSEAVIGCLLRSSKGLSRGQDDFQENLGGPNTFHPGGSTDGFWLNTDTQKMSVRLKFPHSAGCMQIKEGAAFIPDCWADDEGLLTLFQLQHALHHTAKCERAAAMG